MLSQCRVIVVLTVLFAAECATALEVRDALHGKILIEVTVSLASRWVKLVQRLEGGSAVGRPQCELGAAISVWMPRPDANAAS